MTCSLCKEKDTITAADYILQISTLKKLRQYIFHFVIAALRKETSNGYCGDGKAVA